MANKRNLLIDEYPLLVLPSLAKLIGLNEAIALQQVHYWLGNPKGSVEIDGVRWVYNTYEQWQEDNFPFWSVRTVQRTFINLEDQDLVIAKQQAAYDRKKYYRVHYAKLASWNEPDCHDGSLQDGTMEDAKMAPSLKESETTTETNDRDIDSLNLPGQKEWASALEQFKKEMQKSSFENYLQDTVVRRYDGNTMVIGARNNTVREWLENRIQRSAERLLVGLLAKEVTVQFVVTDGVAA